jgi:hypothetical protein
MIAHSSLGGVGSALATYAVALLIGTPCVEAGDVASGAVAAFRAVDRTVAVKCTVPPVMISRSV